MTRGTRRIVAVLATTALATAGTVVARAVSAPRPGRAPAPTRPALSVGGPDRFLQLTGGDGAGPVTAAPLVAGTGGLQGQCAAQNLDPRPVAQMSNGWCIGPAGRSADVLRFPFGLATYGSQVLATSDSGGVQGLTLIDGASMQAVPTPAANLFMGVAVTPSGKVYASGGNADRVFRFQVAGPTVVNEDVSEAAVFPTHNLTNGIAGQVQAHGGPAAPAAPAGDGIRVPGYPGNLLLDGRYLYVAGTLADAPPATGCPGGQAACSQVTVIDTTTDSVVNEIAVGLDAYGLAVRHTAGRSYLYVTNWGDENGRGHYAGGTVSVVDITHPAGSGADAPRELTSVLVGHHPTALQLSADGTTLFVANTNDDSVSVLDLADPARPGVAGTQYVGPVPSPVPATSVGAHPDAMALSPDGNVLFVALAGLNAVELLNGHSGAPVPVGPGAQSGQYYIPTGWYPSALAVTTTASGYRLWVADAKGIGPGPGANTSVFTNGSNSDGTVDAVDFPVGNRQLATWSGAVVAFDQLAALDRDPCQPWKDHPVSAVVCPHGTTLADQPIRHVVYIVTENKTFDQYFGDMPTSAGYNADPKWILYGRADTPNHHSLADSYSLGDNFYSDAEVSVTGHAYTSGATATDHDELTWEADYDQGVRGTHGNGDPLRPNVGGGPSGSRLVSQTEDELNDPQGGYIFEAFARAGAVPPDRAAPGTLSMAIYGEHTADQDQGALDGFKVRPASGPAHDPWHTGDLQYFDTCRADLFVAGSVPAGPTDPGTTVGSPPAGFATNGCRGETIAPAFTLARWERDWNAGRGDTMPNFIYMTLPVNHTVGTNLGSPTPQSMVADNDYALGRIVDALSHSPFWANTVVVNTEDDTQVAGDHVSALRDYLQVSGPLAASGPNHQWGSMPALLRTFETIFGVQPVSLFDRLAWPMHQAFRARLPECPGQPDWERCPGVVTPYTAIRPAVPFALNGPGAPGAAISATMDFSTVDRLDQTDEEVLNQILYAAVRGWPLHIPAGYHYRGAG